MKYLPVGNLMGVGQIRSIKILHCADIHLDMPFTSLGSVKGAAAQRRNEIKEAFIRIIDLAIKEKVDFLLICGDLYEHAYAKKSSISFLSREFERIPETSVIIIPGNHDPYMPGTWYETFKWPENVHIIDSERDHIDFEAHGTRIYGSLKEAYRVKKSLINILMLHGSLDMPVAGNAYNPFTTGQLDSFNMDYIALGHFHNKFEASGRTSRIFNPGSPEPLGFDEPGCHGVYIAEIFVDEDGNKRVEARFVPTGLRQYHCLDVICGSSGTDEEIAELIKASMVNAGSTHDLYSINLKGTVEKGFKPDTGRLEAMLADRCFIIKIRDNTHPEYDLEELSKDPGLKGLFVRKLLEKIRQAEMSGSLEEAKLAEDALYYGLQAMEQGEICI